MKAEFLFLGTGASMGTPVVTCHCAVCESKNPRNRRLRPSGVLKIGEKQFLIDPGPDYRQQALTFGVERVDGVIITHLHYDHIAGLDDLRVYYFLHKRRLPCLISQAAHDELKIRNGYFFEGSNDDVIGGSRFDFTILKQKSGTIDFCGETWSFMNYEQGGMEVTGYRWKNFAYVMDLKNYSPSIYDVLKGSHVLVMSGLRHRPSPAHLTIDEAIVFAQKAGAKQTWFSHVSHEVDHDETNKMLPAGIQLAYDGLTIDVD